MLSEEEKKAIERLNKRYEFFGENPLATNVWLTLDIHNLGIVLNLIEKQQKEIEELKEGFKIQEHNYQVAMKEIEQRWEDKIKAKIEEVEQWELYNMKIPNLSTLDERLGAKIGIKYVLQSLIERE